MQHSETYNDLLDVRDASARVSSKAGQIALDRALRCIASHGLEDRFGLRLLHKHNDLSANEWMRERLCVDFAGPALVTGAETREAGPVANSWQFSGETLEPLEFSDPELIASGGLETDSAMFRDLGEVLTKLGFSDVLGPCLHYSRQVEELKPTETSAFLEKTDRENRANVLRYVERESIDFTASVETKWSAKLGMDEEGKPIWLAKCTCFCSVSENGGHLGTTTHRYEKDADVVSD